MVHKPVLLKESIDFLNVKSGGRYIDATLGLGGHAVEIARLEARVLGIEADEVSIAEARGKIQEAGILDRVTLVRGNFRDIGSIARENGFGEADGVLFDLGMSSWQLEKSGRGFSFQKDEPLDMRMDLSLKVTAADLLNALSKHELIKLFKRYGEEQDAYKLASHIVRARTLKKVETTTDLVDLVLGVKKRKRWNIHPATKAFQALRIAVNDEIVNLRSALPQAFELLAKGGRLVVISFHSLEDREVKNFFREMESGGWGCVLTKKAVFPSLQEVEANRRSRSAKLRALQKHD